MSEDVRSAAERLLKEMRGRVEPRASMWPTDIVGLIGDWADRWERLLASLVRGEGQKEQKDEEDLGTRGRTLR